MRLRARLWFALIFAAALVGNAGAPFSPVFAAPAQGSLPPAGASAPRRADASEKPPLLDRAAVLKEAAEVTRDKYPGADDVLVDDRIFVRYEADGTSVTFDETWMKVLTEKGRRGNQRLPLHFNAAYSAVSVDLLETIKPDGTAVPVDVAAQGKVMTESGQMGANIYDPNQRVLEIGIPGVAVGDIVHYRSIHATIKARVPNTWSDYTEIESTTPIRHFTYEVSAPKERPLRNIALKDEVPGTVTFTSAPYAVSDPASIDGRRNMQVNGAAAPGEAGRIRYLWEARNVPRMYEEPNMPPIYTCVQRLLVSTISDWREISRWYWQLSLPHFQPTEAMKATVADLTRDITDRQKKIEALFKFVSQKVRYLGLTVETEAPGYEPHDVRITFENKYGVCRDKAALLVEMLRLADIEAFPVLIEAGPKKDSDVPQPYFNHAIVAARNPDGAWQLMDPTNENTRELFPAYLSNDSYLVATPEGETLRTSPITPASENLMRIDTVAGLSADGDLSAETVLHFDGFNDNAYRGYFSHIQPDERRAFFEGIVRSIVPGARLSGDFDLKPADLMDTSVPLTLRMRFEARGVTIAGDGLLLLPLPRFGARVGMVNYLLGNTGLEKRKFPFVTEVACGIRETLTLDAPSLGATIALPKYESRDTEAVSFAASLAREGHTLRRTESFLMKVVEFTPAQYLTLKQALKTMEADERQKAIFAAPLGRDDATVLSDAVTCELADAHTWTETRAVRLKILTYAGTKKHSEIKLGYNPAWEEVTLESATVMNPDGSVHSVAKPEQNLMDAAWVGAAPRYPAGKTLVVSLPGIEVGSVIEYKVKRVCRDRPFFSLRESFRGPDPIQTKSLTIAAPDTMKAPRAEMRMADTLTASASAKPPPGMDGTSRLRSLTWTAAGEPAVKPEPQLPPLWAYTPTVCLSCGDWRAYAAELSTALDAAARGQEQAQKQAKSLTEGARSDEARVLAVRDYVARQVRAAGPGLGELPLSAITPADRTLADGYGNSADRAVLLLAMLRAAGFKPIFVLASAAPVVPGLVHPLATCPSLADFGSVLVRVKLGDRDIYLNDTDQYAALGTTPHDGHYGLDLRDGSPITILASGDMGDRFETSYNVQFQANGDALISKRTSYYGMSYAVARKKCAEMVPEQRLRYFQEAVAHVAQAAVAVGDLQTRFDTYPGEETFTVRVPSYAVRDGKYLYFALPATLQDFFAFRSETRENPLYWPQGRRTAIRTEIALPPGFSTLALKPRPMDWKAPQGAGTIRMGSSGPDLVPVQGSLWIEENADLRPALIPAGDYDELLRAQRLLSHPGARTIVVSADKPPPGPPHH